uniref:UDENN domain-containing protein n=1 Tax=Oncorhynchus mykiss TaxID=8022 RepID=A0A8C7SDF0_ONCMY
MELNGKEELKGPVLHIVVVGFHHKKGCQVEYSYPPLIPEEGHDSNNLPEEWKYLPFLALPDGAHNYQEDTVFFHLPPLAGADVKCVYGVSCYRQIEAKSLKVRLADVTRETVQKSVCVLSQLPLYGLLQAKLQLITHAYFEEKDFSQISILKVSVSSQLSFTVRLSMGDFIVSMGDILSKVMLSPIGQDIMYAVFLPLGMIEHGLADSSHYRPKSSVSEEITLGDCGSGAEDLVSLKPPSRTSPDSSESDWETLDPSVLEEGTSDSEVGGSGVLETGIPITVQPRGLSAGPGGQGAVSQGLVSGLEEDQYGLPLAIFTKGYLCLPYMALQQHHLLSDVTVRGFVAGATNILFRQQRHLSDAIVDVEEAKLQIGDPELRKLLGLTTADLRFADYLVKHVTENREDVFLDGTGWEGGDEWIRAQFGLYIHSLLSSTLLEDNEKLLADWGAPFISAWRITHNYRVWFINKHPAMAEITPGHPFQGQYSAADLKLRFSHSVQNSERGKKMGAAVITTSRSVVQTGKAVGQSVGVALSSAKSAMSSWFSIVPTPAASPEPQLPTETKP